MGFRSTSTTETRHRYRTRGSGSRPPRRRHRERPVVVAVERRRPLVAAKRDACTSIAVAMAPTTKRGGRRRRERLFFFFFASSDTTSTTRFRRHTQRFVQRGRRLPRRSPSAAAVLAQGTPACARRRRERVVHEVQQTRRPARLAPGPVAGPSVRDTNASKESELDSDGTQPRRVAAATEICAARRRLFRRRSGARNARLRRVADVAVVDAPLARIVAPREQVQRLDALRAAHLSRTHTQRLVHREAGRRLRVAGKREPALGLILPDRDPPRRPPRRRRRRPPRRCGPGRPRRASARASSRAHTTPGERALLARGRPAPPRPRRTRNVWSTGANAPGPRFLSPRRGRITCCANAHERSSAERAFSKPGCEAQ